MNGNRIIDNSDELSYINYEIILDKIKDKIDFINIINRDGSIYLNNLHSISNEITQDLINSNRNISDILEMQINKKISTLTINHKNEVNFRRKMKSIDRAIIKKLENTLFINNDECFQNLNSYKKYNLNTKTNFGLDYDFKDSKLIRNKITTKNVKSKERLRIDEVEIKIDISDIECKLKNSIKNHIDVISYIDKETKEDIFEEIEKNNLKVKNIIKTLDSEALARIKRSISYLYLEYLCENTDNIYLKDYLRRFKILEDFLINLSKKAENNSKVLDEDIANLFLRGDAFNNLPIKAIIEGNIFEDKSKDEKVSKFALKLKLNGKVNKDGNDDIYENKKSKSSYEYNINTLLDTNEKLKKRLKIFFLYLFMLKDLGDLNYNPINLFKDSKKYIENINKGTQNDNFNNLCEALATRLDSGEINIKKKLSIMVNELDNIIKYKVSSLKVKNKNYPLNLKLHKNIIDNSQIEYMNIFRAHKHDIEYLRYVSINNKDDKVEDILFSTPIKINIKSYNLYESNESKETSSSYDLENKKVVPIVMYPSSLKNDNEKYRRKFNNLVAQTIKEKRCIYLATLQDEEFLEKEGNHYLYRLVYLTISYIIIENILNLVKVEDKKDIFIPIIRYHDKGENKKVSKCDKFIREYSKVLTHLLSNEYRASSQGFDISKNGSFTYKNAMSSLYSKIPKYFEEPNISSLDKLAMVIVTSKKSDNTYLSNDNISTLFGDVVLFDKNENKIRCDIYSSFSDNYRNCDLYTKPIVLRDTVNKIYEMGYKNILYIAKAPYTSTLNITKKEELFFMDEKVINLIKGERQDLIIYPLYYDNFYAIDYKQDNNIEALFIEDTNELDSIINQNSKSTASVFNLYSGKCVGKNNNDKRYRSVILYQTLYNLYKDKMLNSKISEGLISNSKTKTSIINFITMYHYTRYEASSRVSIKMNPYANLIGDDGLSGLSTKEFEIQRNLKLKFNMLAYLTEVKKSMESDL